MRGRDWENVIVGKGDGENFSRTRHSELVSEPPSDHHIPQQIDFSFGDEESSKEIPTFVGMTFFKEQL